ncbi:MAG TPA: NADH-quinone oxidoreductase subunit C [archaeon]|nr:NADH-quinone oxidoreductase subunit C [archaeon]
MSETLAQLGKYAEEIGTKVSPLRKNESVIEVSQERLKPFIAHVVNDLYIRHLMTITGLDLGQNLGIIYHFSKERDTIHVRTSIPKSKPEAVSIIDLVPGAILYEMELHDMFGIEFIGNPWKERKLLLPEDWPADLPPPLLKTTKADQIRKRLGLEVAKP